MQKLIKELQNLYSWNQFYQARTMRNEDVPTSNQRQKTRN